MKVFVACQLSSEKKLKFWDSLSYMPELPLCMIQYWPKCQKETVLHHYLLLFSLFYACLYLQTTSEGGVYRSGHTVLYGNVCEVNFLHSLRWFTETIGRLEKFRCRCSRHISQSLDLYSSLLYTWLYWWFYASLWSKLVPQFCMDCIETRYT